MRSGIYQITNEINGKRYVGSAVNVKKRWRAHLSGLRRSQHENQHLQRAFDKFGESAFIFSVLEYVEDTWQLAKREQHYLNTVNPEYNMCPTAGNCFARPCSVESRRRMSEAHRGKPLSRRHRRSISEGLSGKLNHNYKKHPTEETRAKMRVAWTPERRAAQSERMKGNRLGEAGKGRQHSLETRTKIGTVGKGRICSEETRRKLSKALTAFWSGKSA